MERLSSGVLSCGALELRSLRATFKGKNNTHVLLFHGFLNSTANPKVKTTKGEGLGAHSLDHNISEVEGRARASR
jgi:hypothetical protein